MARTQSLQRGTSPKVPRNKRGEVDNNNNDDDKSTPKKQKKDDNNRKNDETACKKGETALEINAEAPIQPDNNANNESMESNIDNDNMLKSGTTVSSKNNIFHFGNYCFL